ncbi:hypothetical protein EKN06_04820 [Croceicoccus ponticola]|uniref:Uncharacterized protein n=1 Tax=Croceicoccus ponticola TaxID=2217664 RepID=A0A437H1R5_9SPHN|nr:hypothetical protein [Croceicoccus ponticola]RVQ69496.1 hypothetical protein EKN06_04820 [Croceicoccus ponticola]
MRYKLAVSVFGAFVGVALPAAPIAGASADDASLIANASTAAPPSVTANATFVDGAGKVLRKGTNGYTCYPQSMMTGPMCNDAQWEALMGALMAGKPYTPTGFGVSYMLAGEGTAMGVSNKDPAATKPTPDNDWIKDGPHMMLILPDPAMLEGLSTNTADPVYVMWKGTPYQHVMVRIGEP